MASIEITGSGERLKKLLAGERRYCGMGPGLDGPSRVYEIVSDLLEVLDDDKEYCLTVKEA